MEFHISFLNGLHSLLRNLHRIQRILYFTVCFRITAYRAEMVFRIVPAIVLEVLLNEIIRLNVFLLQILHLGCIYIKQVLACT